MHPASRTRLLLELKDALGIQDALPMAKSGEVMRGQVAAAGSDENDPSQRAKGKQKDKYTKASGKPFKQNNAPKISSLVVLKA